MTTLHVIPASALANTYHGTYKDVISRVRWLDQHSGVHPQLLVDVDDPAALGPVIRVGGLGAALVEYTHYPSIVRSLKHALPGCRVAVRAINVEPLQHLANYGWWPKQGPVWLLYGMWRLLLQDTNCKRHADVILSINEWESRVYWDRLPGRAKVEWLPYYCPDHLVPQHPLPYDQRRIIACMPTSQRNRKSLDLVARFVRLAGAMKAAGADYDFVVTGKLEDWGLPEMRHVSMTGFVSDLAEFLGRCRAVAMLSPLGYGFKTTIGDALAAGAHVLAHPKLIQRCPAVMHPYLLSVDSQAPSGAASALARLDAPPSGCELDAMMRERNHALMSKWFGR